MDDIKMLIWGGILFFFKDLLGKTLWSLALYICRGELNHDNNEETPDKYLHFNPNIGTFTERYVLRYTVAGVHWGFFYNKKFVQKFSFWLDWAEDRGNRFPWPIELEGEISEESVLKLLKRGT